jgi:two-component system LytT family response regulator
LRTLKSIIIDDEQRARRVLAASLIEIDANIEVVAEASDVPSGVLAINKHQPDVVFLDIEMPNYSGFELLDFIKDVTFDIIFVTAYNQYAIKAFEISAVDYLLKPVRIDLLEKAVNKIEEKHDKDMIMEKLDTLKSNLKHERIEKLAIPVSDGLEFIKVSDIMFIEADGSYVQLNFLDGSKMIVSKNLKYFANALESAKAFYRVHRSYLVNLNCVKKYNRHDNLLVLENGTTVKVAREGKTKLEDVIKNIA